MLWVGGGIILHGLAETPLAALPETAHHLAEALSSNGAVIWIGNALLSALFGFVIGLVIAGIVHVVQKLRGKAH